MGAASVLLAQGTAALFEPPREVLAFALPGMPLDDLVSDACAGCRSHRIAFRRNRLYSRNQRVELRRLHNGRLFAALIRHFRRSGIAALELHSAWKLIGDRSGRRGGNLSERSALERHIACTEEGNTEKKGKSSSLNESPV